MERRWEEGWKAWQYLNGSFDHSPRLPPLSSAPASGLVSLDRLMLFVLFLESTMPSAQNTVIIHS